MLKKKKVFKLKTVIFSFLAGLILLPLTGCMENSYISGASFGYYIWEEDSSIFVEWSADRKDTNFDGAILTDGKITACTVKEWEEEDVINVAENKINFSAALDKGDYSDGFSFTLEDYTYLEFDLKINDGYDLSRINLGGFLESPEGNVFRIGKDYFSELQMKHWYQKRPFSEFFYKLFSNKYFTFLYLFILGIIIIEILRVTVIAGKKRKIIWIGVSYIALILIEACIYFILRFLVS